MNDDLEGTNNILLDAIKSTSVRSEGGVVSLATLIQTGNFADSYS